MMTKRKITLEINMDDYANMVVHDAYGQQWLFVKTWNKRTLTPLKVKGTGNG